MAEPVIHLITRLELGGAQRNTLYTVGHLDRARFEPALAWGPGDALDGEARALQGVACFEVPELVRPVAPGCDLAALARLRGVMRELRPAVVHTHSSKAGILGRLAARLEGVPVVVHSIHGFGFTPLQPLLPRWLFFAAERVVARWTDHFIAVSRANRDLGVELGLFAPDQVSVIRSGIRLEDFADRGDGRAVRRRLGVPGQALVVTQVGNFKPQKAPLDFVRTAAEVGARVPDAHFVMVGDGVLRAAAEELAARLGVADRVVFAGWYDDVPGLLAATDVSVLTSRHEGLPRAVVESLAAGVPVVATAVDGTPEVVQHGVNGFLAEPGDVGALARRLCTLLEDSGLRRRMGVAAREGLAEFDIDLMVRSQEELYTCLLGRSRS
jgi:glycosyltransferase involved in cell wall biosynthesis